MTVDVNVRYADEAFLEEIDEIIEETMIQLFILQPGNEADLEKAVEDAEEHPALFYVAPLSMQHLSDANCVGYYVDGKNALAATEHTKPLFIDETLLDDAMHALLQKSDCRGIILNATRSHETLQNFYLAIGPGTVDSFDTDTLASLPMDRIVLQSGYPDYGFDTIQNCVKRISDAMFRPEQSIIANATKSTLTLLGFKK